MLMALGILAVIVMLVMFIVFTVRTAADAESKSSMMFVNKNGQSGFSSPASKFRNYHNEPYGGPFGADPYYVYGMQHQNAGGVHDGFVPARL